MQNFQSLEHRLEFVTKVGGIDFINDSKEIELPILIFRKSESRVLELENVEAPKPETVRPSVSGGADGDRRFGRSVSRRAELGHRKRPIRV